MNCKMTSTANLNENEIILFILGDEKKESIQAIAIKDHVSTEIYLKDNVKVKHLQNSIKNKRIITFNGTSYDLPLLQKNNFKLEKKNHMDLYYFYKQNVYTDLKRYTMESILANRFSDYDLSSLKVLNEYFHNDIDRLYKSLEDHIKARFEIYKGMQEILLKHNFSFHLLGKEHVLCLHKVQFVKDFLLLTFFTLTPAMQMEFHFDHAEIKTTSENTILVRTPFYSGSIGKNTEGKAIRTEFSEIQDNSLTENFYLIEKEHVLLLNSLEKWIKILFDNL